MPKGVYPHKPSQGFQKGHPYYGGTEKPKISLSCKYCDKGFEVSPALVKHRVFCSRGCKAQWQKENLTGENNPNWQGGGNGSFSERIKKTVCWREWRQAVFERDNFTCRSCGQEGDKLIPHHIKSKQVYPELVFRVDNGMTLCKRCHKKIHRMKPANQTVRVKEYPLSLLRSYALSN